MKKFLGECRLLAFPTAISLGWKLLPETNNLANYGSKGFYIIGPLKNVSNKLECFSLARPFSPI
jgi:hypothetical protein